MKLFIRLTLLLLVCCGFATTVSAADAPIVREVYVCNLNDGKDMDDLMAARDFYLKQMEKGGQEANTAFVWTPLKAFVDFDFLWFNNSPDLVTYGRQLDTFLGSAEGQASMDRFNSVATCQSGLAMRRQFFQAPGEFSGDPDSGAIISSARCNFREGHGQDDVDDLLDHAAQVLGSLGLENGMLAFATQPITQGANSPDLFLYTVQGTMEDWASTNMGIQASPGGPSLGRHFNTILDCRQSLFAGQQVVSPPE